VVERVQAPEAEVFVSQASLWEMTIKLSIGNAHLLAVGDLETDGVHRDPF
jgi:PIN domain nuclease of toxin-antitoxin system